MFSLTPETGLIELNVGDTGSVEVEGHRDDGEAWTEDDRAVFTVKGGDTIVIERTYALDSDTLGNGVILIEFHSNDTKDLKPGSYTWEIRWFANPYYDEDDNIVGGDIVDTPGINGDGKPMPFVLNAVQKDI